MNTEESDADRKSRRDTDAATEFVHRRPEGCMNISSCSLLVIVWAQFKNIVADGIVRMMG